MLRLWFPSSVQWCSITGNITYFARGRGGGGGVFINIEIRSFQFSHVCLDDLTLREFTELGDNSSWIVSSESA